MVEVRFEATKTNSVPVAPTIEPPPKHKSDGPLLIGTLNAVGVTWLLWQWPAIAFVSAICAGVASSNMRKSILARMVSVLVSCSIAWTLISSPPTLQTSGYRSYYAKSQPLDLGTKAALYFIATALLFTLHRVVGAPDAPESAPIAPVVTPPAEPEDPLEKIRKAVFDEWFTKRVVVSAEDTPGIEFKLVFADYKRTAKTDYPAVELPSYNEVEFKKAFKSVTNKEPVADKYQGVSLQKGALI